MEALQIVSEFRNSLREALPNTTVYFYGSRFSDTAQTDSDYDVLVLMEEITPALRDVVYDIAWEIGFRHDAFISPVLATRYEFSRLSSSPFFNSVKNKGVLL